MRVRAECSIDLDENRKVWVTLDGDGLETPEDLSSLAEATSSAAYRAFALARGRMQEGHGESGDLPEGEYVIPGTDVKVSKPPQQKEEDKLKGMGET